MVTVRGVVQEVATHLGRLGTPRAQIFITSATRTIEVNLGLSSFLEEKKLTLAKGDSIAVTGSKVKRGDGFMILAREIRNGTQSLVLRSEDGSPKWEQRHR